MTSNVDQFEKVRNQYGTTTTTSGNPNTTMTSENIHTIEATPMRGSSDIAQVQYGHGQFSDIDTDKGVIKTTRRGAVEDANFREFSRPAGTRSSGFATSGYNKAFSSSGGNVDQIYYPIKGRSKDDIDSTIITDVDFAGNVRSGGLAGIGSRTSSYEKVQDVQRLQTHLDRVESIESTRREQLNRVAQADEALRKDLVRQIEQIEQLKRELGEKDRTSGQYTTITELDDYRTQLNLEKSNSQKLTEMIDKLRRAADADHERVRLYSNELEKANQLFMRERDRQKNFYDETVQLRRTIADDDEHIRRMNVELEKLREMLAHERAQNAGISGQVRAMESNIDQIKMRNSSLTEDVSCLQKTNNTLRNEIVALQNRNGNLMSELERERENVHSSRSSVDQMRRNFATLKSEQQQLVQELQKYRNQNKRLTDQVNECARFQESWTLEQQKSRNLQDEIARLQRLLELSRTNEDNLVKEIEPLRNQARTSTISGARPEEVDRLKFALSTAQRDAQDASAQNENLRVALANERNSIQQLRVNMENIEKQLGQFKELSQQLRQRLAVERNEKSGLIEEKQQLRREFQRLQTQTDRVMGEIATLRDRNNSLQRQMQVGKDENTTLRRQLRDEQQHVNGLSDKLADLQRNLAEEERIDSDVDRKLRELSRQLETMQRQTRSTIGHHHRPLSAADRTSWAGSRTSQYSFGKSSWDDYEKQADTGSDENKGSWVQTIKSYIIGEDTTRPEGVDTGIHLPGNAAAQNTGEVFYESSDYPSSQPFPGRTNQKSYASVVGSGVPKPPPSASGSKDQLPGVHGFRKAHLHRPRSHAI